MGDWRALARAAIVAALALGLAACVTKRAAAPAATPAAASFSECATAKDGPTCLIDRAMVGETFDGGLFLDNVIEAGAVSLVLKHRDEVGTVRGKVRAFTGQKDSGLMAVLNGASEGEFIAALGAAAAAQVADDPLAHAQIKPLVAKAARGRTAMLALVFWNKVAFRTGWRGELMRPRGVAALWRAVIAAPPKETKLLGELVQDANMQEDQQEAVALARLVLARGDANEDSRGYAGFVIAQSERGARSLPTTAR